MKELKDLQVGDIVLVSGTWHRRLSTIQRVTKTQVVVNNIRFNRLSGWQCNRDRWNTSKLYVPTEEQIAEIKEEETRKERAKLAIKNAQECIEEMLNTYREDLVYISIGHLKLALKELED